MSHLGRPIGPARGLLVAALVPVAACLDAPPASEVDAPESVSNGETAAATPARYLTHFLFAGIDGTAFFARFEQSTEGDRLARTYDAWWSGPRGWRALAEVRDTLPVPRAAWRILPAPGLDVRVGDSREVVALTFHSGDETVELQTGEEVAMLTGPTGQRESVGLAGLSVGGETVGGLLFLRRAARALHFAEAAEPSRGFLLADPDGNGILIESSAGDSTVIAHTWLHGSLESWSQVAFVADTIGGSTSRRWSFDIPAAALSGTIRAVASPATAPVPAFRVECDLVVDGDVFRFTGVAAPLPLP